MIKIGVAIAASYLGIKAPELFLNNKTAKRQKELERAYPNTLDLLLICAESGMSIEHAVRKVSQEIGVESIAMAEEMALLAAEMSYLAEPPRRLREPAACGPGSSRFARSRRCWSSRRNTARRSAPRCACWPGKPRPAHDRGREEGRRVAADAHRADDPVLPARPVRAILTPAVIQINHWN